MSRQDILQGFLDLFPPSSRGKPRLMALAAAVLSQAADLAAMVPEVNQAFSPASAEGKQLDDLAAAFGLSRLDTSAGPGADDGTFRSFLLLKLSLWNWDGTNAGTADVLANLPAGSTILDNQNGTVTIHPGAALPAAPAALFPVPAGIRAVVQ